MTARDPDPAVLPEEELAGLIAALPPAPAGWTAAAQELPRATAQLDGLVARAVADAEERAAILADLERALAEAGVEPTPVNLASLRARLDPAGE